MIQIKSITYIPIVLLLLFAFYMFSHHLDQTSLWADEGWTIAASAEANPVDVLTEWVYEDVHPPLYFIELNIWRQFTGNTIFEMRYFAVLMSFVSVAVMYRLGKAVFASEKAGLTAALLFTLHDLVHVLTQEVRHYSQQQTLTALSLWLYWRFWKKPTPQRGLFFVISGTGLLYSHYWGGFVLLGLAVHALLTQWRNIRPFIMANIGIGVLFTPWVPAIYHQITLERPRGLPHALDNSWVVYKTLAFQLLGTPEIFWVVVALAGVMGIINSTKPKQWLPSARSLLPFLVVLFTIGLSLSINTQYPTLSFRSLAVIIPAFILLVTHTLEQFRWREFTIMMSFIIVQSLAITAAAPVERPPWPQAAEFIAAHTSTQDAILLEMDTDDLPFMYYLSQNSLNEQATSTETIRIHSNEDYQNFLQNELSQYNGIWLVKFGFLAYDPRPEIQAQGFVPTAADILDFGRYADGRPVTLYRFDRPAATPEISFGDVMQLMRYDIAQNTDDTLTVNLLWQPATTPDHNYTVSTFLLAENGLPPQPPQDSYPFEGRSPTADWEAGQFYFDSHSHDISQLAAGNYRVGVKVYYFTDINFTQLEIAPASDCSDNENCEFVLIDEVTIP